MAIKFINESKLIDRDQTVKFPSEYSRKSAWRKDSRGRWWKSACPLITMEITVGIYNESCSCRVSTYYSEARFVLAFVGGHRAPWPPVLWLVTRRDFFRAEPIRTFVLRPRKISGIYTAGGVTREYSPLFLFPVWNYDPLRSNFLDTCSLFVKREMCNIYQYVFFFFLIVTRVLTRFASKFRFYHVWSCKIQLFNL